MQEMCNMVLSIAGVIGSIVILSVLPQHILTAIIMASSIAFVLSFLSSIVSPAVLPSLVFTYLLF